MRSRRKRALIVRGEFLGGRRRLPGDVRPPPVAEPCLHRHLLGEASPALSTRQPSGFARARWASQPDSSQSTASGSRATSRSGRVNPQSKRCRVVPPGGTSASTQPPRRIRTPSDHARRRRVGGTRHREIRDLPCIFAISGISRSLVKPRCDTLPMSAIVRHTQWTPFRPSREAPTRLAFQPQVVNVHPRRILWPMPAEPGARDAALLTRTTLQMDEGKPTVTSDRRGDHPARRRGSRRRCPKQGRRAAIADPRRRRVPDGVTSAAPRRLVAGRKPVHKRRNKQCPRPYSQVTRHACCSSSRTGRRLRMSNPRDSRRRDARPRCAGNRRHSGHRSCAASLERASY
jgi:hypothetical protein